MNLNNNKSCAPVAPNVAIGLKGYCFIKSKTGASPEGRQENLILAFLLYICGVYHVFN